MKQATIKAKYEKAKAAVTAAHGRLDVAQAKLRVVQSMCRHPNKFPISRMGEMGYHCPDCGWGN